MLKDAALESILVKVVLQVELSQLVLESTMLLENASISRASLKRSTILPVYREKDSSCRDSEM